MTINEPGYGEDADILGDRGLGLWLHDDGNFYFSTYNFKYNAGYDNVDRHKTISHNDQITDWAWVYFGYNRAKRQAIAYVRQRE